MVSSLRFVAGGVRADAGRLGLSWTGSAADSCTLALRSLAGVADELAGVVADARTLAAGPAAEEPVSWVWPRLSGLAAQAWALRDRLAAMTRSSVNERALAADLHHLHGALASAPLTVEQGRRLLSAQAVQGSLDRARSSVDPVTGGPRPATLLAYDPSFGDDGGRAVVAVGDAATADDVAVLVPGLDTDVEDLGGMVGDAVALSDTASADEPLETTAVVAWLGYDTPEMSNVALPFAAMVGGGLLHRDLRDLAGSRSRPAHTTVVAHSYGSTTAAEAAKSGAPFDDLVLMGSPGVMAFSADALRPAGHVYVAANSRDPVTWAGWFGPDPAGRRFGATRIRAESREGSVIDSSAHSQYLDEGTESLDNVARVVVGDQPELADQRDPFWVPWDDPERGR